jgi:heat shock protein HslJ
LAVTAPSGHRRYPDPVVLVSNLRRGALVAATTAVLTLLLAGTVLAQEASPAAEASPVPAEVPVESRPEGIWDVIAFDPWTEGLVEPSPGTTYTTSFALDGRLEGETGCGVYYGAYLLDGETLAMRVISKGPDPCGPERTEEAVAFSVAVDAVAGWRPTADGLELLDEAGTVRLVLGRAAQPDLTGAWIAERLARPNGKLAAPPGEGPVTVRFDADGGVSGSTGCRFFEGRYEHESDRVVIAPIDTVGLPCEGAERSSERRLLRVFDEAVLWARDAGKLTLSDGFGSPLLVLRPAPAEAEAEAVDGSATADDAAASSPAAESPAPLEEGA